MGANGVTALILASENGHLKVVKLLLDRGAMVDSVDKVGDSSLISAAINGHVAVVNYLVEKGAFIELTNRQGWTA
ncbi:hypothetical protein PHYSODRAFT_527526, partial [Phytophthora sojae]